MHQEQPLEDPGFHEITFFGDGAKYFAIVIVNGLLTLFTLGLYYPWAKAKIRKYLWNETELVGNSFTFHGTGKEMFRGFVIAYAILVGIIILAAIHPLFIILYVVAFLSIVPLAIYGAWRYRVSRTSWRGIYFSFDGTFTQFLNLYIVQALLTIVTLGLYGPWMRVKIQKYLFSHTKLGQLRFSFHGDGGDLFVINLLGGILLYPTLGIYMAWYFKNRFNFTINHTRIEDEENEYWLSSDLTGSEAARILIPNFLLLVVTLGLAFPWTLMRRLRMQFDNIVIPSEIDIHHLEQDADDFSDATGDELTDILDIGIDF